MVRKQRAEYTMCRQEGPNSSISRNRRVPDPLGVLCVQCYNLSPYAGSHDRLHSENTFGS